MPKIALTARIAALVSICAVAAPVAIATASAGASSPSRALRGQTVRTPASERAAVRVGGRAAVAATSTAQGFLGISTSLNQITELSGPVDDPDTPFVHLVDGLSPGAAPVLRLGGVATDDSWWPVPGLNVRDEKYLYKLTPRWAADVKAMLTAMGGTAILGVDLETGSQQLASAEVSDFDRYIGPNLIDAFELGNEPEFWPVALPKRHPPHDYPYKIAHYGALFSRIASGLGDVPLAGPASGAPNWLSHLGTLLGDIPSRVKLATIHAYPLKTCSALAHASVSQLFARASIQGLAETIHHEVRAAASHGKPLRVDEFNGVSCGGQAGVSNSFGEALWALNVLPALWQAGVQGVNMQTVNDLRSLNNSDNEMIAARRTGAGWRVSVQPEYYGLLAFAQATPAGSHLLRTSDPGLAHFYRFAVRAPDGFERVVLTNVGSRARTVGVSASGAHATGSVSLLSAKSLTATGGTTLAGQRLSAGTGQLIGRSHVTPVTPNAKHVYAVVVPAHAAAILTLPGSGRGAG